MDNHKSALEQAFESHLDHWQNVFNNPSGQDKSEMAEQAIKDLYAGLKKEAPAIFWCDSPFQLCVLPSTVTSIIESKGWQLLLEQMANAGLPGSSRWESCFDECWNGLATTLKNLDSKLIGSEQILYVDDTVRAAARVKLKQLLRQVVIDKLPLPGSLSCAELESGQNEARDFCKSVSDLDIIKNLMSTNAKVDQEAKLKLTANIVLFTNLMFGNVDPRLVYQFIPSAEKSTTAKQHDEASLKQAAEFKARCNEIEFFATRAFMLCLNLIRFRRDEFPQPPPPDSVASFVSNTIESYRRSREERRPHQNYFNRISIWFPYAATFLPFALACRLINPDFFGSLQKDIDIWACLAEAAGAYHFANKACFVCSKPTFFRMNSDLRLDNADGPVAAWKDGYKVYAWKGLITDPDLIENKGSLNSARITAETNIETRRIMIDIFGEANYLLKAGAKVIAQDSYGTLLKLELEGDEAMVMVKVQNSTPEPDGSFKDYFLRVPPDMETARQAVAWTFGLQENEYGPIEQS